MATNDELIGVSEIAARFGVAVNSAWRWTQRADFPAPAVRIASGRAWRTDDVDAWTAAHLPLPGDRKSTNRRPTS